MLALYSFVLDRGCKHYKSGVIAPAVYILPPMNCQFKMSMRRGGRGNRWSTMAFLARRGGPVRAQVAGSNQEAMRRQACRQSSQYQGSSFLLPFRRHTKDFFRHRSQVPHLRSWPLIDFIADLRQHTPTGR